MSLLSPCPHDAMTRDRDTPPYRACSTCHFHRYVALQNYLALSSMCMVMHSNFPEKGSYLGKCVPQRRLLPRVSLPKLCFPSVPPLTLQSL